MDVDLRKLRYFVAVAEELHFGRAAEILHIAQPVLSRQIVALEDDLQATLFTRDRRSTALTAAGEQLLADAQPLLANAAAMRRRVSRAARGVSTFTVGFMPGLVITAPLRALAVNRPDLTVEVIRTTWQDQTDVIHDGRADVSFVRLPAPLAGLKFEPLHTEPRVAVLPAAHRLAGKEAISITDLADEHLLQDPDLVPEWRAVATELRLRVRRETTPAFGSVEEKLEHIAAGHGLCILPRSVTAFYSRADIAHVIVHDLPPNQIGLVWDSARRSRLIHDFAALAQEHAETLTGGSNGRDDERS